MEDQIAWGLVAEEATMNCADDQGLPPGFRFHPTDEELVSFYLASKVFNGGFCGVDIAEVDLNRCEPWELPEGARMGEREWYFFSMRDRKYPSGLRTNRATGAGYWKATGKDREVCSAGTGGLVGMKKTLVFYKGRAPRGEKTKWVLHEYRLDGEYFTRRHSFKEEWVICRILHKVAAGDVHYKKGTGQTCSLLAPPSSSSPNPCSSLIPPLTIPNLAQLESLLQSSNLVLPPSNPYQESSYPLFPPNSQLPISLTSTAPLPVALHETQHSSQAAPPQQEETTSLLSGTCWIDYNLLHNPFLCDVGALAPAGVPAHPHDLIFAAAAAAAAAEYDSLVS